MNEAGIAVVISQAELLSVVESVKLLPQRFVLEIVKIQTSNDVLSVHSVTVNFHHLAKARPDTDKIRVIDLMLPFMTILHANAFLNLNR